MVNMAAGEENLHEESADLLSMIVERSNMQQAYSRVMRNKGAAGVDGLTVQALKAYLQQHWPSHREKLLEGRYRPQAVRKVEIPKSGGGMRTLGIPTVLDRLIQQAVHQVLSPLFEEDFSDSSYGFRPGRSAGQAVQQLRGYVEQGYRWVVDLDLEKFFDRVNHDILMSRVARRVKDKRLLKLLRGYLEAGLMEEGLVTARKEGTPQGGPLSPLLSNILLTDLDRELERRGHKFCRYADDCNVYVKSKAAGERVMKSITGYLEKKLKLRVNRDKSGVARPWDRKFLGYSVCRRKQRVRLRIAPMTLIRLKGDLKVQFRHGRGRKFSQTVEALNRKLKGWMNYFRHIGVKDVLQRLDGWIRRHLRKIIWLQWKRPETRVRKLIGLGLSKEEARRSGSNRHGPWWNSKAFMHKALPKKWFDRQGLISLLDYHHRLKCLS